MRVVLDTNVFVSSFFGGNPRKIIDLWRERQLTLCISNAIVEEYLEVLTRMGLKDVTLRAELLDLFRQSYSLSFLANPPALAVCRDADDDKFIACAVALKADVVVSGDKDLLTLKNYLGIPILNPREFLKRVRHQKTPSSVRETPAPFNAVRHPAKPTIHRRKTAA